MSARHNFSAHRSEGAHAPGQIRASRYAQQRARAAELDDLRTRRPLTEAEYAEADRLAHSLYMRLWRQQQAAIEARLA